MNLLKTDFGIIFWIHILLIIFFVSSPWLISWYWTLLILLFFWLQSKLLNNCSLVLWQFSKKPNQMKEFSWYNYYLKKLGFNFTNKQVRFFVGKVLVNAVFIISLIVQSLFFFEPLLF